MAHPYHKAGHRNDPGWLRGLEKYVEKASAGDIKDTVRNYAVDPEATKLAAYDIDEEKK